MEGQIIKCGPNRFFVDGEIDGEVYLRPIIDNVAYWPGIRVSAEDLRDAPIEVEA